LARVNPEPLVQTLENFQMKKTLVALAALAATSAFAQSAVTLYGRATVDVSQYSATGAFAGEANDLQARSRVSDNGSRLGFLVNEDLGSGNRAFITCETGMNVDSGGANGQGVGVTDGAAAPANTATNFLCSREGHVGIGNTAYELRLGRQNVYWTHGELNQTGANFLSGDTLGAFVAPGAGMTVANATRLNNTIMVQLNQNSFLGADFAGSHVYYSTNGGEAATANSLMPNKSATQGFKLNWNNGNWAGMVDYTATRNGGNTGAGTNNAANAGNFDQSSVKYSLGYKYAPGSIISYTMWDHKRDYNLAASQNAAPNIVNIVGVATGGRSQTGSGFNLVHNFGGEIYGYAQYAVMNRAANAAGAEVDQTGATGMLLGVRKNLSKRTGVFAWYGSIKNEQANAVNFTGGAIASGNSALGADPKVTAIGVMHNF